MEHPFLKNRQVILFYVLGWAIFLGLLMVLLIGFYKFPQQVVMVDSLVNIFTFAILGIGLWYPLEYTYLSSGSYFSNILNLLGLGIATLGIWLISGNGLSKLIFAGNSEALFYINQSFPLKIIIGLVIVLFLILIYYLIIFLSSYEEKRVKETELKSLVKEAELNLLKYKINPHFLFNSLNSISSLTLSTPEKAHEMILKLSDYLRYSLQSGKETMQSFADELDNVHLYLDIEKIRFRERIDFIEETDEECMGYKVPGMILQPLFENAIKHGVHESTETVRIKFICKIESPFILIKIRNNYVSANGYLMGTGTGLESVKNRLIIIYNRHDLMEINKKDDIFEVKLKIPVSI